MWLRFLFVFVVLLHGLTAEASPCRHGNKPQQPASTRLNWAASAITNNHDGISAMLIVGVQQVPVATRIPVPGGKTYAGFLFQNSLANGVCSSCNRLFLSNLTDTLARLYIANRAILL